MIKLTELMVGNWVYNTHHQKAIKLTPYDFFTHSHDADGSQRLLGEPKPVSGRDFEPIPLTSEILEKNGWKFNDLPFVQGWEQYGITIIDNRITFGQNVSVKVEFVHELQHVLRLCKIEKEIVL